MTGTDPPSSVPRPVHRPGPGSVQRAQTVGRAGEDAIRATLNELPQAIAVVRMSDEVVLDANPALEKLIGLPLDRVIGSTAEWAYVDPTQRERIWSALRTDGRAVDPRVELRGADGIVRVGELRARVAELRGDKVMVAIFNDLSAQHMANARLQASESHYRTLVETAQAGVWLTDLGGRTTFASRWMERILGYGPGEMLDRPFFAFLDDSSRAEAAEFLRERFRQPSRARELKLLHKRGTEVWVSIATTPIADQTGRVVEVMALVVDVTDRRRAEEALRESEERWRAIAENPFDFVVMVDRSGVLRYANRAPAGTRREEIIGSATVYDYADPTHHSRIRMALERVFLTGEPTYFEAYFYATGEWYGNFTSAVRRGGEVVLAAMLGRNITEAKRTEAQLTEAKSRLEEAERIGKIGSWHLNIVRDELSWSAETYRIFGLSPKSFEPTYEAFLAAVHPDDRQLVRDAVGRALERGESYSIEHAIVRPDGTPRLVHARAEVYVSSVGRPIRILGTMQDITARKEAEREVRRLNMELEMRVADRTAELAAANAELESFAYSVSHDLRAPLRAINGFSNAVLTDYGAHLPAEGQDWLHRIENAATRMGILIDELLELAKLTRVELTRERVDVSAMVEAIGEELRQASGRDVSLSIEAPCWADVDPGLMRVALQNLLDNAWKYTARETDPTVEFGCRHVVEGEHAFFVRDNGVGFDPREAGKLFGAFQRLHSADDFDGTGIGLATVRRIVHRHGGRIWAESIPGAGATFYFTVSKRLDP